MKHSIEGMTNLPQSFSIGAGGGFGGFGGVASPSLVGAGTSANNDRNMQSAEQLVLDLTNPELRENALLELSKVYSFHFHVFVSLSYKFVLYIDSWGMILYKSIMDMVKFCIFERLGPRAEIENSRRIEILGFDDC